MAKSVRALIKYTDLFNKAAIVKVIFKHRIPLGISIRTTTPWIVESRLGQTFYDALVHLKTDPISGL